MILPYYKIDKTEEEKQFFFTHVGYFNFWDEYLIDPKLNLVIHDKQKIIKSREIYILKNPFVKESQKKCLLTFQK